FKNVGEAASARQKSAKKRSLHGVNEHFEPTFNAAMATQVVFQQPASPFCPSSAAQAPGRDCACPLPVPPPKWRHRRNTFLHLYTGSRCRPPWEDPAAARLPPPHRDPPRPLRDRSPRVRAIGAAPSIPHRLPPLRQPAVNGSPLPSRPCNAGRSLSA